MSDFFDDTGDLTTAAPPIPTINADPSTFGSLLNFPDVSGPGFALPPLVTPSAGSSNPDVFSSVGNVATSLTNAITGVYGNLAKIAQAQAQVQVAKAQGQNAVQVAKAGLPSPTLLLLGGGALLALMIVTRPASSGSRRR